MRRREWSAIEAKAFREVAADLYGRTAEILRQLEPEWPNVDEVVFERAIDGRLLLHVGNRSYHFGDGDDRIVEHSLERIRVLGPEGLIAVIRPGAD